MPTIVEEILAEIERENSLPGLPTEIQYLRKGDSFHESKDGRKVKPGKILENPEPCKTEPHNIHFKTSRGNWCIARCQTVLAL